MSDKPSDTMNAIDCKFDFSWSVPIAELVIYFLLMSFLLRKSQGTLFIWLNKVPTSQYFMIHEMKDEGLL